MNNCNPAEVEKLQPSRGRCCLRWSLGDSGAVWERQNLDASQGEECRKEKPQELESSKAYADVVTTKSSASSFCSTYFQMRRGPQGPMRRPPLLCPLNSVPASNNEANANAVWSRFPQQLEGGWVRASLAFLS